MEPGSVALIGAGRQVRKGSFNVLENLLNQGFPGEIYPVNPHADELLTRLEKKGIKLLRTGGSSFGMVTHHGIRSKDIDVASLGAVMKGID